MVDLPSIDVPTAIAAAFLTFGGGWLKEEYYRRKKGKKEAINWYQELITICERIEHTHSLAEMSKKYQENSVNELYDGIDIEQMAKEAADDDVNEEDIREIAEEVDDKVSEKMFETAINRLSDDISEHYVALREHMVKRPRASESPEKVEKLLSNLWGMQLVIEINDDIDLEGRNLTEFTSNISKECEKKIEKQKGLLGTLS